MTHLLIDAGNTRVKWALVRHGEWLDHGALEHHRIATLAQVTAGHAPVGVLGTNVAGAHVAEAIAAALPLAPRWLTPRERCCGVINRYDDPAQLGADRWAALIGARAACPGPLLVVGAGTATTVDVLSAEGEFLGGLILPGEALMRRSLARDTAGLPLAEGDPVDCPRNTRDAIVTGCLQAQAGAIERMFRHIGEQPGALCVLAGGAAERIAPLLALPLRRIDDLVLRGLARIAADEAAGGADDKRILG
ncbi:type III pantothenate kinase [Pseudazoarcus pumilus]|uniref:Type III pantothenate kinase n=1 Tax=Pseudazoarcus pumilus TaxID=2067960 RepID=A0A2I6S4W9_9RHOO|nr:type III pantothenate kinase [Pseudazoarcus pumilus]AUN94299.1 type III pantothenate kinase [Pseudazoarcus pumilus]